MNNFSTGLLAGALLGVGIALTVNPVSKKDMRKMRCRANKMVHNAGRMMRTF